MDRAHLTERRRGQRRASDRTHDDLLKTFSIPNCRTCLEHMADGVLLLDSQSKVVHATTQAQKIAHKHDQLFSLAPKFAFHQPHPASRYRLFTAGNSPKHGPLSLLLDSGNELPPLLITCFRLPKTVEPGIRAACFMITSRDPTHVHADKWQLFTEQFNISPAEARLCRDLANGLTINDYCNHWNVTSGTARSQLHNVFCKTSLNRQTDLLRLIFLFTRP